MLKFFAVLLLPIILFTTSVSYAAPNIGIITGKLLTKNGESMEGGTVLFYNLLFGPPPFKKRYWRMPDSVAKIEKDGIFTANLPEGKYYLGAIKRIAGKRIGPPAEGDIIFVGITDKKPNIYTAVKNEKNNIGTIMQAVPYKKTDEIAKDGQITAIEGVFTDSQNKPVKGATVFAYTKPEMNSRPVYVSEPTDKDGVYILRVPEGGIYYLKARNGNTGGPSMPGEIMGYYGGKTRNPAIVKTGERLKSIGIQGMVMTTRTR